MSKTFRVVTREEGGGETEEYITADGVSPDKGDNMVRLFAYGADGEKEVVAVYHAWQVKSAVDTDHLVDKPALDGKIHITGPNGGATTLDGLAEG